MIGAACGGVCGVDVGRPYAFTWATDATSGKAVPSTQAHYDAMFDCLRYPRSTLSHSHKFDVASGNITATVGTDLTVTGTLDYQQAVSGWTTASANITETAAERAHYASGTGPSTTAGSVLLFGLVDLTGAPAATRTFMTLTLNAATMSAQVLTNSTIRVLVNGANTAGSANHVTAGVFPIVLQHNKPSGDQRDDLFTHLEKLQVTYDAAVAEGAKGWGTTGTPGPVAILRDGWFAASAAEWTVAKIRAFLRVMGWAVSW